MSKTIHDLKSTIPQIGALRQILIRPKKRGEITSSDTLDITVSQGLLGDHYSKSGGKRMVTLIQEEHLDVIAAILDKEIDPTKLRRNLVVSGINLLSLHDMQFRIGPDVILHGTGHCHPCSRMETNLGPGGYNAVRGHGGITATVIQGGRIRINDSIRAFLDE
ncbi:MAG: MOSC domain-containing protein [Bacteroidota bacterium]